MTKNIIKALALVCLIFLCFLIYKTFFIIKHNNQIAEGKRSIPQFSFYDQNLSVFASTQVLSDKALCIFYYNAECEFCQDEVKHLQQQIVAFNDVQILMVSTNPPTESKKFALKYGLNGYKNIIWLYDKDFNFSKWFGHTVTPSVFIYNKLHKLIKEYRGEVKIEAILKSVFHDKEG
jgi:peroxiredoxin